LINGADPALHRLDDRPAGGATRLPTGELPYGLRDFDNR
jgi:hypothetical protein